MRHSFLKMIELDKHPQHINHTLFIKLIKFINNDDNISCKQIASRSKPICINKHLKTPYDICWSCNVEKNVSKKNGSSLLGSYMWAIVDFLP